MAALIISATLAQACGELPESALLLERRGRPTQDIQRHPEMLQPQAALPPFMLSAVT